MEMADALFLLAQHGAPIARAFYSLLHQREERAVLIEDKAEAALARIDLLDLRRSPCADIPAFRKTHIGGRRDFRVVLRFDHDDRVEDELGRIDLVRPEIEEADALRKDRTEEGRVGQDCGRTCKSRGVTEE